MPKQMLAQSRKAYPVYVLTGPVKLFCFQFNMGGGGGFRRFENCAVKLSAKETKWNSLAVRTHPTFLETLI